MLTAYLGALGFTRLVERLGLHTVPLPSLQYWLSKTQGANLVEAFIPPGNTEMVLAYRSLVIAISGEVLKDKCLLVGVGLVYTPPYLPKIAFSVTYMHLNKWHSAAALEEVSEDRLVGTSLLFIQISGESEFFPVANKHPVLLDVKSTEVVSKVGALVLLLSLWGFQLHTLTTWHSDGSEVC